jgi:hypothetical protein
MSGPIHNPNDPNCQCLSCAAAPAAAHKPHFVSASCAGEWCSMHRNRAPLSLLSSRVPATHKLGEEIPHDDPNQIRHNLTAYVCCECFILVVGAAAPCAR